MSQQLCDACWLGDTSTVRALLVANPNLSLTATDIDNGSTPLMAACSQGHTAIVAELLQIAGIDVNQRRPVDGVSALYAACRPRMSSLSCGAFLTAYSILQLNCSISIWTSETLAMEHDP